MASACFGDDVDLVLSKARPTSSAPGRKKVSKGFLLICTFQPPLGLIETGKGGISKEGKKTILYSMPIMYLALC